MSAAVQVMNEDWGNPFAPALHEPFLRCADEFERAFREHGD